MTHSTRWNKKRRGAVGAAHLARLRSLYGNPGEKVPSGYPVTKLSAGIALSDCAVPTGATRLSKKEFWNSLSPEERQPLTEAKQIFGELEFLSAWKL